MFKKVLDAIGKKVLGFFGFFRKMLFDILTDKSDNFDEKRVLGFSFMVVGLLYAIGLFKTPDNTILITLLGAGGTLLGGAIVGDVTNPQRNGGYLESKSSGE